MATQNSSPEPASSKELNAKLQHFLAEGQAIHKELDAVLATGNPAKLFAENLEEIKKTAHEFQVAVGNVQKGNLEKFVKDYGSLLVSGIAFLLALASFVFTFFWLNPNIKLSGGPIVSISYQSESKTLNLGWRVVVANYGRKMDVINWVQAKLVYPEIQGSIPLELPQSSLDLRSHDGPIFTPFPLKEDSATEVEIRASQKLGKDTFDSFFDQTYFTPQRTQKRELLELGLTAEQKSVIPLSLCFALSSDDLQALAAGQILTTDLSRCKAR